MSTFQMCFTYNCRRLGNIFTDLANLLTDVIKYFVGLAKTTVELTRIAVQKQQNAHRHGTTLQVVPKCLKPVNANSKQPNRKAANLVYYEAWR